MKNEDILIRRVRTLQVTCRDLTDQLDREKAKTEKYENLLTLIQRHLVYRPSFSSLAIGIYAVLARDLFEWMDDKICEIFTKE